MKPLAGEQACRRRTRPVARAVERWPLGPPWARRGLWAQRRRRGAARRRAAPCQWPVGSGRGSVTVLVVVPRRCPPPRAAATLWEGGSNVNPCTPRPHGRVQRPPPPDPLPPSTLKKGSPTNLLATAAFLALSQSGSYLLAIGSRRGKLNCGLVCGFPTAARTGKPLPGATPSWAQQMRSWSLRGMASSTMATRTQTLTLTHITPPRTVL